MTSISYIQRSGFVKKMSENRTFAYIFVVNMRYYIHTLIYLSVLVIVGKKFYSYS